MGLSRELQSLGTACVVVLAAVAVAGSAILVVARQVDEWDRGDDRADLMFCAQLARQEPSVWCSNRDGMVSADDDD